MNNYLIIAVEDAQKGTNSSFEFPEIGARALLGGPPQASLGQVCRHTFHRRLLRPGQRRVRGIQEGDARQDHGEDCRIGVRV